MNGIPTYGPTSVAAVDERDPKAGNASHKYAIQFGGPADDDLLAIIEHRLEGFQSGPFACVENADALDAIKHARASLAIRVARRIAKGVLGVNANH